MNTKLALAGIVLITLLTSLNSCIQTSGIAPKAELAVLNHELTEDADGKVVVLVTIKNISNYKAELAEVRVTFYDVHKDIIDSSSDSILNLKPDETWEFTLGCSGSRCSEIKSYDVEVTAGTSSGIP